LPVHSRLRPLPYVNGRDLHGSTYIIYPFEYAKVTGEDDNSVRDGTSDAAQV
jgi:hypothetical protein